MKPITKFLLVLLSMTVASAWAVAQKQGPETKKAEGGTVKETFNFDDAKVGATPKGFTVAETKGAGTPATWKVEAVKDDAKHKNAVKVDTRNKEGVFNMLLSEKTYAADVDVSVQIRPGTGEDDQGGGLVWRAKDADNYYIARWNPLEKNLRLYKVVEGSRTQLKSVDIDGDPKTWHELRISQRGPKAVVEFDGKKVIEAEDATFKDGGKVGFWTKADASSWFDDLSIEWKK